MVTSTSSTTASTSAATKALLTSLGAGSGVDMASLATDLAAAQFAGKTDRLATKSETLAKQISSASNLKSMILALATSLGDRVRVGDLSPQPKLGNASVATASLLSGAQPSGTYSLEVTALASAQTLASRAYSASTDVVGGGTLTLRFGTVAGSTFTEDTGHAAVPITIPSGATLAQVAGAINGAKAGVAAYVAQTVDGAQLVLKGPEGAANGFVLDANETPGQPGLADLAWAPGSASGQLLATARNAEFKVDGLSITAKSNTVSDVIPGVELKLTATNTGSPTSVGFGSPGAAITSAMTDLTSALNEIAAELNTLTDPKTGELARDNGTRTLRRSLSSLASTTINPTAAEGVPATLAELGLSTQRDGTFTLDTKRLADALAKNPEAVSAMFTTGLHGVYSTIDGFSRGASLSTDPGSLAGSISRYTRELTQVGEDQEKVAEQQETLRAQMAARFTASDARVSASRSTLTFLKNQIAAWNGTSN